jgi:hypothetical protein
MLYNMTDITNVQAWIMPVTVAAFGIFAAIMFYYRNKTAGEAFNLPKFLQTLGLGAIAALVLYAASATVPDVDAIITEIAVLAPGGIPSLSAIFAALLVIWNGLSKKTAQVTASPAGVVPQAAVSTPAAAPSLPATIPVQVPNAVPVANPLAITASTSTSAPSAWQPDFSVVPAFPKVKSGQPVTFSLETVSPGTGPDNGPHRCKEVIIDWMDGSPLEVIPMGDGFQQVTHTYVYVQGISAYYSHDFFPEFTTVDAYDGAKKSFNSDGRCCDVEVSSLVQGTKPMPSQ